MIHLTGDALSIADVLAVARQQVEVAPYAPEVVVRMNESLLTAAQAIDLRPDGPAKLGHASRVVYEGVRRYVSFMERDRECTHDIEKLAEVIRAEHILHMLETVLL